MSAQTIDKTGVEDNTIDKDVEVLDGELVDEKALKAATKKRAAKKAGSSKVEEQQYDAKAAKERLEREQRDREIEEAQRDLEALSPFDKPVQWMIGKTPEHGGTEKQYSVYVQEKLPYMPRMQFFALVSRTFSEAIKKSGGASNGTIGDWMGEGSLIERGRSLTQRDLTDASQFMSLAFELIAYSPDFLVDCYLLWLNVPRGEREWAIARFREPWKPEEEKWGLKEEDHDKMVEVFIDQNYEAIRDFFAVRLVSHARRLALHEKAGTKGRESKSAQSK